MLIGMYEHTVDTKGRVSVPVRYREELGEHFVITQGMDNCLALYPMTEWNILVDKVKQLPMADSRAIQRYLFSKAFETEIDAQGRIVIPLNLRAFAGITKDVVIAGLTTRVEIWDREAFFDSEKKLTNDSIVAQMSQLGF